jgi:hypothetical protein
VVSYESRTRRDCGRLHVTMLRGRKKASGAKEGSTAAKVRAHRARLREAGLRPVQIWVPDVRSPQFAREAHRQSRAVARSPFAADDQAFVDAVAEWTSGTDD